MADSDAVPDAAARNEFAAPEVTSLVWLLRIIIVLHCVIVLAQSAFAGNFLDGQASALRLHQLTGTSVITAISLLQVIVAAICWRRHQQTFWFALSSLVLFGAEMIQIGLGFTGQLPLHVPLGVAIFGVSLVLLFASLRKFDAGNEAPPTTT